jgi:hypothetical protein
MVVQPAEQLAEQAVAVAAAARVAARRLAARSRGAAGGLAAGRLTTGLLAAAAATVVMAEQAAEAGLGIAGGDEDQCSGDDGEDQSVFHEQDP